MPLNELLGDLDQRLRRAIKFFWQQRGSQSRKQGGEEGEKDRGGRSAVTGGKHLDGFLRMVAALLEAAGLQRATIYWNRRTELPGWFRAEKQWDLLVVVERKLVAIVELKSQVGSFGNNFNNRTEEALGNAMDLWAAYEEGAFKPSERPWLGYVMLLEDSPSSNRPIAVKEPHFKVFPEFKKASYGERYNQLLTKLVRSRMYDAGCFLMSSRKAGLKGNYREPNPELSFHNFARSLLSRAIAVASTQPPGLATIPRVVQRSPKSDEATNAAVQKGQRHSKGSS